MAITFIIPAFNCADTLVETVESIYLKNFNAGDEVIIINDCSTDETGNKIDLLIKHHPTIQRIDHLVNKGTAAASRNTGIEQANNDLIFCLDSDNMLVPGSIEKLKNHLINTSADAAAFGELHYFSDNINIITHKWVFNGKITFADALSGHIWPGPSGNYLFTRESWVKAGRYFEPSLENQTLDSWTFGIRQLGTGSRMVTLINSWYFHRYGHQSHYVRNQTKGNQSLSALIGIIPFLDMIETDDINYIFSEKGRFTWYDQLDKRSLQIKGGIQAKTGEILFLNKGTKTTKKKGGDNLVTKLHKKIKRIIK